MSEPETPKPIEIDDLLSFEQTYREKVGDESCDEAFYRIGLTLELGSELRDCWCEPINVVTLADTHMDGAHFALMRSEDEPVLYGPVVLVAPDSSERPHVIVGDSLREFLCLGCYTGYNFGELPHNPEVVIKSIEQATEPRHELLSDLCERFELAPWIGVAARLVELQDLYLDDLVVGD